MLRPRTIGKIVVVVIMLATLTTAFLYAVSTDDQTQLYRGVRAVAYAIIGLSFATVYRYFED